MRRAPLTLIVIAGVALATTAGAATDAGNRAAAKRDAVAHLRAVRLPAGAVQVGVEPKGDHGYLKPERLIEASFASAVRHEWWRIPGATPAAVIAYVHAHPPEGARETGGSGAGNFVTGTSASGLTFQWSARPGVLGDRLLDLTATALPEGATGVLAETQSVWIVQRPRSERVPAGIRAIVVTSGLPGRPPEHRMTVTSGRRIARVIALVDALPAAQPGVTSCPAETDPRQITLVFEPGATLTVTAFRPWTADPEPCGMLTFTIHGRRQPGLQTGHLVRDLQRVLGTRLVP